jgi:hypothetical protein
MGPRANLDNMEDRKFLPPLGLKLRPLGRPARSQSIYRLRYPGSMSYNMYIFFILLYNDSVRSKNRASVIG